MFKEYIQKLTFILVVSCTCIINGKTNSVLDRIDPSTIHATSVEQIISYLEAFPFDEYKVVSFNSCDKISRDRFYIEKNPKDYVKHTLNLGYSWEPSHANYIMQYARPGSIAIDVGAHIGTHTITMSHAVGAGGTVLAFEPNQRTFRELVLNVAGLSQAKNVHFYMKGVSSVSESIPHSELNDNGPLETIVIDSLELTNVSILKIDADGSSENSILRGLENTIRRNKPVILLEIAGGICYNTASPQQRDGIDWTRDYVTNLGYRLINLGDLGQGCCWDFLCLPK